MGDKSVLQSAKETVAEAIELDNNGEYEKAYAACISLLIHSLLSLIFPHFFRANCSLFLVIYCH